MKHEYSCGAVLFVKTPEGVKYVLVKEKNGNVGFPEGHIEKGETEHECALREIKEETGLSACIVSGFCQKVQYSLPNGHVKHVTYFAAFYDGNQHPVRTNEVSDYILTDYEGAVKALSFKISVEILEKFKNSRILSIVK